MYTNKITAMAWAKLNFPEQIEALKLVFHSFASEFYYFLLYFPITGIKVIKMLFESLSINVKKVSFERVIQNQEKIMRPYLLLSVFSVSTPGQIPRECIMTWTVKRFKFHVIAIMTFLHKGWRICRIFCPVRFVFVLGFDRDGILVNEH